MNEKCDLITRGLHNRRGLTATKIQYIYPILELSFLTVALEHENLCLLEGLFSSGIQTTRILGTRAHARQHKGGGDLDSRVNRTPLLGMKVRTS